MNKNIVKNISKTLSSKCSQKLLDHDKQSATDAIKNNSKRVVQKTTKQPVIWLEIKRQVKFKKSQKVHHKIDSSQLKVKQKI